jgi:hypothetical protein
VSITVDTLPNAPTFSVAPLAGARRSGGVSVDFERPLVRNRSGWDPFRRPSKSFSLRVSGSVLEVSGKLHSESNTRNRVSKRSEITGFSSASRRRLFKLCAAIPWDLFGRSSFVTLTYPRNFTLDGERVKRDLDTFYKAVDYNYGKPRGVWKMEFQRRGAPHFHMVLAGIEDTNEFRAWVSATWCRIVGSGDLRHLTAGTQVQRLRENPAAYFAGYVGFTKGSKEYQHYAPEGYEKLGRYWGAWGVSPEWLSIELDPEQFVAFRRLVSKWCRSHGIYDPRGSRLQGFWVHTRRPMAEGRRAVPLSALVLVNRLGEAVPGFRLLT